MRTITTRVLRDGTAVEVPFDDARTGDRLPGNGAVTEGGAWIDESMDILPYLQPRDAFA